MYRWWQSRNASINHSQYGPVTDLPGFSYNFFCFIFENGGEGIAGISVMADLYIIMVMETPVHPVIVYSFLADFHQNITGGFFSKSLHTTSPPPPPVQSSYIFRASEIMKNMVIGFCCSKSLFVLVLKGTVLRDRFRKRWRKLTDLGLNKGRGWFLNFSEAPLIFGWNETSSFQ